MTSVPATEIKLPNGQKIVCLKKAEAKLVYEDVPGYFRYGIELGKGAIVFDVGANIGLFSLYAFDLCEGDVAIYAFEPIPAIYQVLNMNVSRASDPSKIKTFACGLASDCGHRAFAYHTDAPILSNAYAADVKEEFRKLKETLLRNCAGPDVPTRLRPLSLIPSFLRPLVLDRAMGKHFDFEEVVCPVRSASEVIRDEQLQRIDLLKINVEKAEYDVLMGITEEDWKIIRQVVIEIHDIDGRLRRTRALLERHGLSVIQLEQTPVFKGSEIYLLYARRREQAPSLVKPFR